MSKGPFLRKYGVEATFNFDLFEVDGIDLRKDSAPGTADMFIMKDEGAEAATTNAATDEGRTYSLVLTATEMQAARIKVIIEDQTATKTWLDTSITIETYGNASAQHAFDLDAATVTLAAATHTGAVIPTVTTLTGHTAQTGDSFARLGAPAGASVSADVADVPTVAEFNARTLVAAAYFDPAADTVATVTTVTNQLTAAAIADQVWDEAIAGHAGVGSTGEQLAAAGSAGDPWATALPGAYGAGTAGKIVGDNVDAPISTVDTVVDDIQTQIGTAGAGLTNIDLPDQTMDITGNLSGSVGSVTGAVGSVTGAVGSVAGNVDGSTASVTGAVGSVTGAVGSVTAEVSADVTKISGSATAADNLEASALGIVSSTAATGTLSTTQMTTNLTETTDDHYNGRIVVFTSGVLAGQATDITDYTGATKLVTMTALTEAPSNTDAFVIV